MGIHSWRQFVSFHQEEEGRTRSTSDGGRGHRSDIGGESRKWMRVWEMWVRQRGKE